MTTVWTLLLLGIVAAVLAVEAYGYWYYGVDGTLSVYMRTMGQRYPAFAYGCGFVTGGLFAHFWWSVSGLSSS